MGYLFVAFITYYLLLWVTGFILRSDTEQEPAERAERWRSGVGWAYWLVNVPLLFTVLLRLNSSSWSLSAALLPVWLVLLPLSGLVGGAYLYLARFRWPLRVHALLLGLFVPLSLLQTEAYILYEQYPFTVKEVYRDYVEQPSFKDYGPTSYPVKELHVASWGFDYYMGDLHLGNPPGPAGRPGQEVTGMGENFWQRVRSLHFAPDSALGRLKLSPLLAEGKYNSFTGKVEVPVAAEQVVDFWLDASPAPRQNPKEN